MIRYAVALALLVTAGCGAVDDSRSSEAADARTADARASQSACPPGMPPGAAMDTTDFWHVYLDGRRVLEGPSFSPQAVTMAALREARGICILYFTDAGAENGARITALAVGANGGREIASKTIGEARGVEFRVPELVDGLGAADGLVFRIEFPDRPTGRWSGPHDFLRITAER